MIRCTHSSCSIVFVAGLAGSHQDVQLWERKPEQVAPDRSDDWLLEPPSLEEARLLFPQLDEERALLRYQQLRLEMRERDGRGF